MIYRHPWDRDRDRDRDLKTDAISDERLALDATATPTITIAEPTQVLTVIGSAMNVAPMKRATTGVP